MIGGNYNSRNGYIKISQKKIGNETVLLMMSQKQGFIADQLKLLLYLRSYLYF